MVIPAQMMLVLLLASLLSFGSALDCPACLSGVSWEDCQEAGSVRSCTLNDVNGFHQALTDANPNLTLGDMEDEFQCFALHLLSSNPGKDNFSSFVMGCTFKKTRFCQGWPGTVAECRTFSG